MAQLAKLVEALKECNGPFPYRDVKRILEGLGCEERQTGGGSRRRFLHVASKRMILLHEPHPGNEIKPYVVREIRETLIEMGLI
ncbi:type II toxin-antitoxin system HicA family toxin [Allomesorhizobium alhagi]|uniref:HicA-related protein n=1 Tax=Mesorhizobium alhagi CCNWXJ12-2 TaxID=1107882 RepID=H0HM84_9HYPH|nr:HicA-related protein [Mesorhizobium alhagi CCNWXJ12-2]